MRITTTEGIGIDWLTPALVSFQAENPAISLELLIRNRNLNLLRREADIAVRLGRPRQGDLVARRLGDLTFGLYASQAYVRRHGRPTGAEDLGRHQAVGFDEAMVHAGIGQWVERSLDPAPVVYRADSVLAQRAAVRAGCGIGAVPCVFAGKDLERVLDDRRVAIGVWLVTHPGLRRSARIRAVFDFIAQRFDADRESFEGDGAPH